VSAEVDVSAELAGSGPGDQHRLADHIADQMVARLGDLLCSTHAEPLSLEDLFDFLIEP
jgi:hypothetical protein